MSGNERFASKVRRFNLDMPLVLTAESHLSDGDDVQDGEALHFHETGLLQAGGDQVRAARRSRGLLGHTTAHEGGGELGNTKK